MIDTKPRKDTNIQSTDLAPTYVDSTNNQATININELIGSSSDFTGINNLDVPVFDPGAVGARIGPGEGGFAYADTPEATVYIQKKEWVDGEWTYVTGSNDERKGKNQEVLARIALGNLITRKLDLLNNHELFTKFSELNAASSAIQQDQTNNLFNNQAFADILTLSGTPVTKYYTETVEITQPDIITENAPTTTTFEVQIATKVQITTAGPSASDPVPPGQDPTTWAAVVGRLRIRQFRSEDAPIIAGLAKDSTVFTTGTTQDGGIAENVVSVPDDFPSSEIPKFPTLKKPGDQDIGRWWAIDLTKLSSADLFPSGALVLNTLGGSGSKDIDSADKVAQFKVGYIPRALSADLGTELSVSTDTVPFKDPVSVPTKPTVTPADSPVLQNVFNGVIELANIQSITTSINNKVTSIGHATVTLENPNNVLYISEDDIEIALGTRTLNDEVVLKPGEEPTNGQNIETTDPLTGRTTTLYYFEGKYYTQTAFNLVSRVDTSAAGNFTTATQIQELKDTVSSLKDIVKNLQIYQGSGKTNADVLFALKYVASVSPIPGTSLSTSPIGPEIDHGALIPPLFQDGDTIGYDAAFHTNGPLITQKINSIIKLISIINSATIQLTKQSSTKGLNIVDTTLDYRRSQLRKYFQNRTIFEVYDRVFIWMSTPSRTTSRLDDGTLVNETSNGNVKVELMLRRIQEIMGLIQQLSNTVVLIGVQQKKNIAQPFDASATRTINDELFADQKSATYTSIAAGIKDAFSSAPTSVDFFFNQLNNTDSSFNSLPSTNKLDPTIDILTKTIDKKIEDLQAFSKDKLPSGDINSIDNSTNVDTAISGLDPRVLLHTNNLAGLNEEQIQVFQGVITGISRSYNDGRYTISLACEDNLNFLSRSRFTLVPGLNTNFRTARAILDDPIYRSKDAWLDKIKADTKVSDLVGRWKTGILSVTAQMELPTHENLNAQSAAQNSAPDPNIQTETDIGSAISVQPVQPMTEPFRGADPATIISLLVTGIPFDVDLYLQNAIFTGAMNVPAVDASGKTKPDEILKIGPIEAVRQRILGQVRKFGDFEPFLDRTVTFNSDDRDTLNLSSAIRLGTAVVDFAQTYVKSRPDSFPGLGAIIQKQQQQGQGIYAVLNKDNIDQLISFNEKTIPSENKDIHLITGALQDERLDFIATAAINNHSTTEINNLLGSLVDAAQDLNRFTAIVPDVPTAVQKFEGAGDQFILSENEISLYSSITSAANARTKQGVVLAVLFDKDGNPNDKLLQVPNSPDAAITDEKRAQIASLRGIKLSKDGKTILSGNPLQATKASIIFKHKPNYLTVSDQYLHSPNLIDYVEKILPSPKDHQLDENKTVLDRCKQATIAIDWELFADTQGHLRFKPPTYNRTLLKHIADLSRIETLFQTPFRKLFDENGLDVAVRLVIYTKYQALAQTIKSGAVSQIKSLLTTAASLRVEQDTLSVTSIFGLNAPINILGVIVPDMIDRDRLRSINALVRASTISVVTMESKKPDLFPLPGGLDDAVKQINDEVDATISKGNANSTQISPATGLADLLTAALGSSAYRDAFNAVKQYQDALDSASLLGSIASQLTPEAASLFDLSNTSTSPPDSDATAQAITDAVETAIGIAKFSSDLFQKMSSFIASLQSEFSGAIQTITDEKYIHIIPSAIIITEEYSENPPEYTRSNLYSQLPKLGDFPSVVERESLQWAGSVDYDLWRNYGYILSDELRVPFLRDASQAILYSHQLMARQYSKILKGRITVRGDSKYQVADTVFVEDENLYFYVVEIQHNFSYGQSFTTTLILEYGRRPGQYIPYPFDLLGDRMISGVTSIYNTDGTDLTQIIDAFKKEESKNGN